MTIPPRNTIASVAVTVLICGVIGVPMAYAVGALFDSEAVYRLVFAALLVLAGLLPATIIYREQLQKSLEVTRLERVWGYYRIFTLAFPCAVVIGVVQNISFYLWHLAT